jgi:hypothetical protein
VRRPTALRRYCARYLAVLTLAGSRAARRRSSSCMLTRAGACVRVRACVRACPPSCLRPCRRHAPLQSHTSESFILRGGYTPLKLVSACRAAGCGVCGPRVAAASTGGVAQGARRRAGVRRVSGRATVGRAAAPNLLAHPLLPPDSHGPPWQSFQFPWRQAANASQRQQRACSTSRHGVQQANAPVPRPLPQKTMAWSIKTLLAEWLSEVTRL